MTTTSPALQLQARELCDPGWNRRRKRRRSYSWRRRRTGSSNACMNWTIAVLRSFAQSKYFTNQALFWFCKCGLPISLGTHINSTPCVHMDESASHWQCGLACSGDLHIHHSHSHFVAIKIGKKKARAAASWPCKSARGILLTIFNWKIFIIYQFVCSTNNNNRSSTRTTTTRAGAQRSRNKKEKVIHRELQFQGSRATPMHIAPPTMCTHFDASYLFPHSHPRRQGHCTAMKIEYETITNIGS